MRSATTADISDSIAPSMATVIAGEINPWTMFQWNCGMCRWGGPEGMPPKRVPMVSTGNLNSTTAIVPSTRATMYPGSRLTSFVVSRMTAIDITPSNVASHEMV